MDRLASRRDFLRAAGGAVAAVALVSVTDPAGATPATMQAAVDAVIGSGRVTPGRLTLELPPLVENGNTVPLVVSVESPMTPVEHVKAIHVFTEKNPQPEVATFRLGPRDTQTVLAVAELSDGSFWSGSAAVVVTLAACLEEA
jgi:sulfur-oxidizing protein SoxY